MLFIGKNIIRLVNIDSTNNYAAQLLRSDLQEPARNAERHSVIFEGTVILAQYQKSGKGQRGNSWESEKGKNLTFSIILHPNFLKPEQQFLLTEIISLALSDFLKSLEIPDVSVKWPNDVLVNGKKIAGILIENIICSNQIIHSIIGIGFNVNQTRFYLAENPTSLKIITGKNFFPDECLEKICNCIEARYLKIKSFVHSAHNDYLQLLFQLNEWKKYCIKGINCKAKITGVSQSGMLILEKENSEIVNCNFKEIKFL